jgi:hypothetical protein
MNPGRFNPAELRHLGKATHDLVVRQFRRERMTEILLDAYQAVVKGEA